MMRLMEVSSDPNAFVATQVNRAESDRCVRLILIVDKTPPSLCSSLIVYLLKSNYHNCSMFVGFIFFVLNWMYFSKKHRTPINRLPYETRCTNLFHACNVNDCTHVKMHCGVNC